MSEEKLKPKYDALDIFQAVMNNLPEATDTFLLGFIMFRNIASGANTITESGLTSPNSGVFMNVPNFGPDGQNISRANKDGSTTQLDAVERAAALQHKTKYQDGTIQ